MNKLLLSAAIAGILTAATATNFNANAAEKEKCFGIAKAGKNSCASADGAHSCAGHAKKDNDPNEWKYVDQGSCKKMGGSLKSAVDMNKG